MATEEPQITDQNLMEVFNRIKGDEGSQRPYIIYEDFKRECLAREPECLKPAIQESKASGDEETLMNEFDEHFRNICESF